jgi:hypothetical protein
MSTNFFVVKNYDLREDTKLRIVGCDWIFPKAKTNSTPRVAEIGPKPVKLNICIKKNPALQTERG